MSDGVLLTGLRLGSPIIYPRLFQKIAIEAFHGVKKGGGHDMELLCPDYRYLREPYAVGKEEANAETAQIPVITSYRISLSQSCKSRKTE